MGLQLTRQRVESRGTDKPLQMALVATEEPPGQRNASKWIKIDRNW